MFLLGLGSGRGESVIDAGELAATPAHDITGPWITSDDRVQTRGQTKGRMFLVVAHAARRELRRRPDSRAAGAPQIKCYDIGTSSTPALPLLLLGAAVS